MSAVDRKRVDAGGTVVVRMKRADLWLGIVFTVLFGGALIYGVLPGSWNDASFPQDERTIGMMGMWFGTFGLMFLMAVYIIWAWMREWVEIGREGIVVRRIWGDREMKWREITAVRVDRRGQLCLKGPCKMVIAAWSYDVASREIIGKAVCERVPGQSEFRWEGWNVRQPVAKALSVREVLLYIGAWEAAGAVLLIVSFLGSAGWAGMGAMLALLGASSGTWAALRMRNWRVAAGALIGWAVVGLGVWRVFPLFHAG